MLKTSLLLLFLLSVPILAQQQEVVDFKRVQATVIPKSEGRTVQGEVTYTFDILKATDSIYLDAIAMQVSPSSSESIPVTASDTKIFLHGPFDAGNTYTATFTYTAKPKQALYFFGDQIWTQGQGKYTSHWLPSLDDMNDKMEFDLTVAAPPGKTVVANGALVSNRQDGAYRYWKFDMQSPMSSYLVALAIGTFRYDERTAASGVPIQLYIKEEDWPLLEPTYRYSLEIFNFLETEIGVPYPWQNYKQVPVRDFLYAGMENTTATLFSEAFVVDSIGFTDRNYVNVNAHELAHQWFGNLITETESTHHWLQEGFATYYALLAEEAIFGSDYFFWKLYNSAEKLKSMSEQGKGEAVVNPSASSLTYYEKGAWALHQLRDELGAETFKKVVQEFLTKYKFDNVTTNDFMAVAENISGKDLRSWRELWLEQAAFPSEQAYRALRKSPFITSYFELVRLRTVPLLEKKETLLAVLKGNNEYLGQEALLQLEEEPQESTLPLYRAALENENIYIRQGVALGLQDIPQALQSLYETLLEDASYITQEAALYSVWSQFEPKRAEYLDKLEGTVGFQDKNVRQLWLALAFVTEGYQPDRKQSFVEELRSYTGPRYSFEVRQKAFGFVSELRLFSDEVIRNLVQASIHPNWRFRTFSRELLEEVLKNPGNKSAIYSNFDSFSEEEKAYLNRIQKHP
jgi:aminopeptidase N